ncbi:coiled-coil domain-containing protein [Pseudomonas sp. NPDC096950]|uniref:coiled-coil domain-containing protein n=1 Tax=Pseudomonas sp. NPDC096950 TaxID=3364485 RepID=UPI00383AD8F1
MSEVSAVVSPRDPREVLYKIAKELSQSAMTVSERACLVKSADGSKRMAMTGISSVNYPHSGIGQGSTLHKVSFRFIGDESDPMCRYHPTEDMAWALVDPRSKTVLFGPERGMLIRQRSEGIGSYILGQLIRLVNPGVSVGGFKVHEFKMPLSVEGVLPGDEQQINSLRCEAMLRRAGFYVSPVGAGLVVGARKALDLQSRWNLDKIWFMNPAQLAENASIWLSEGVESASSLIKTKDELRLAQDDLESARGELERERQALQRQQRDHDAQTESLKAQKQADEETIAALRAEVLQQDQKLVGVAQAVELPPVPPASTELSADAHPRILRVELGRSVMGFLWVVLAVVSAFAFMTLKQS